MYAQTASFIFGRKRSLFIPKHKFENQTIIRAIGMAQVSCRWLAWQISDLSFKSLKLELHSWFSFMWRALCYLLTIFLLCQRTITSSSRLYLWSNAEFNYIWSNYWSKLNRIPHDPYSFGKFSFRQSSQNGPGIRWIWDLQMQHCENITSPWK